MCADPLHPLRVMQHHIFTLLAMLAATAVHLPLPAGAQTTALPYPADAKQTPVRQLADNPPAQDRNEVASPDVKAASWETAVDLRRLAEDAAKANNLPSDYFIRLIAYESGFNRGAVSPAGAEGIAQFMPSTAQDRGLKDPFDPTEALPKSAALLSDLKKQFGNLGLAAAAYNAGSRRVQDWLDGRGHLPQETRRYVYAVTGRAAEDWAPPGAHILKETDDSDIASLVDIGRNWRAAVDVKKNWELALLLSISSSPSEKALALETAARLRNDRAGVARGKRQTPSRLNGELSLCSSCIVRKFY
jgi:hypothetical protein